MSRVIIEFTKVTLRNDVFETVRAQNRRVTAVANVKTNGADDIRQREFSTWPTAAMDLAPRDDSFRYSVDAASPQPVHVRFKLIIDGGDSQPVVQTLERPINANGRPRTVAHGSGMYDLTWTVMPETPQSSPDATCEPECHEEYGCCEIEIRDAASVHPAPRVARERDDATHMDLASPPCDVKKYPRYIVKQPGNLAAGRPSRLVLDCPGLRAPLPFTPAHWEEHLRAYGQVRADGAPDWPQIRSPATWGPRESVPVPCCVLEPSADGPNVLRFEPSLLHIWDVYNLPRAMRDAQPFWESLLWRTLMFFPKTQLDDAHAGALYFDFRVGNPNMGPRAAVGVGGTNLRRGVAGGTSAVFVAYASLNAWYKDRLHADAAEEWYSLNSFRTNRRRVIGTIYHEFGHLFDPPGLVRLSELWRQYFWAMFRRGYDGLSLGPDEAFSEAYRTRMTGAAQPTGKYFFDETGKTEAIAKLQMFVQKARERNDARGNQATQRALDQFLRHLAACEATPAVESDLGPSVDAELDQLGLPTARSVNDVRPRIIEELRSRGMD